ncbi:hypothetical protein H2198_007823 [Neophaeococcomyces mojaviensis]|uniref:Uncharacterized protein n=1 Tax=Neophaeococcomyces mojaviensis TaxID=3383035 RepID=A0ACC2ZYW7_9EURO|nr:hypothetical protein H2198_007823 [Knufia sp. JES_112]
MRASTLLALALSAPFASAVLHKDFDPEAHHAAHREGVQLIKNLQGRQAQTGTTTITATVANPVTTMTMTSSSHSSSGTSIAPSDNTDFVSSTSLSSLVFSTSGVTGSMTAISGTVSPSTISSNTAAVSSAASSLSSVASSVSAAATQSSGIAADNQVNMLGLLAVGAGAIGLL